MHPDLHSHSHNSDGSHSPEFLLQRARDNGVSHLAITDHDFITWDIGWDQPDPDLKLIPGVEISADWAGREVHIVGLFVSPSDEQLQALLSKQRHSRQTRMEQMSLKLEKLGINGLFEYVEALPCQAWTRSHAARFLIEQGHCKNWQKAFSRFLSRKGRIHVPAQWCSMNEAVGSIRRAGGIAVLAHPGRYGLSKSKITSLVQDFLSCGGDALEGSYANIDGTSRKHLCRVALENRMYISVGSDFHDASRHWTDIGKLPGLDQEAKKNAIWHHPRWHYS